MGLPLHLPQRIAQGGRVFEFIAFRVRGQVAIYRGVDAYLRIGPEAEVRRQLAAQTKLQSLGTPAPQVLDQGRMSTFYYYIESSLGNTSLGTEFERTASKGLTASNATFDTMLKLVGALTNAQIQTLKPANARAPRLRPLKIDRLLGEAPWLRSAVNATIRRAFARLAAVPLCVCHGDFNPYNMFSDGVVDFEHSFNGWLGYDAVYNLVHSQLFPISAVGVQPSRTYSFTTEQVDRYIQLADSLCQAHHIMPLSDRLDDLAALRCLKSAANTVRTGAPFASLQRWRRAELPRLLDIYLNGGDVLAVLYRDRGIA